MNQLGKVIKEVRENTNMTQEQLADKLGISKSALWNYENEKREIPLNILLKLLSDFGHESIKNSISSETLNILEKYLVKQDINDALQTTLAPISTKVDELCSEVERLRLENAHLKEICATQKKLIASLEQQINTYHTSTLSKSPTIDN